MGLYRIIYMLFFYEDGSRPNWIAIFWGDQKRTMFWPVATYTHPAKKMGLNIDRELRWNEQTRYMKPIWFCQPIRCGGFPRWARNIFFIQHVLSYFRWGNTGNQWIVIFQFSETPMGIEIIWDDLSTCTSCRLYWYMVDTPLKLWTPADPQFLVTWVPDHQLRERWFDRDIGFSQQYLMVHPTY